MAESSDERRRLVVDVLRLIAEPQEQLEYERNVPIANVPAELVEMWFTDQYHPGDPRFDSAFSPEELDTLAAFARFYESRIKELPIDQGVASLQSRAAWKEIVERARTTLAALNAI